MPTPSRIPNPNRPYECPRACHRVEPQVARAATVRIGYARAPVVPVSRARQRSGRRAFVWELLWKKGAPAFPSTRTGKQAPHTVKSGIARVPTHHPFAHTVPVQSRTPMSRFVAVACLSSRPSPTPTSRTALVPRVIMQVRDLSFAPVQHPSDPSVFGGRPVPARFSARPAVAVQRLSQPVFRPGARLSPGQKLLSPVRLFKKDMDSLLTYKNFPRNSFVENFFPYE